MVNLPALSRKWPFFGKQTSVREELTGLIETSIQKTDTEFNNQEGFLLRNMLGLRDLTATDVSVPRVDIMAVNITEGFDAVIQQMSAASHSRVPAHEGDMDNVCGMLHIKDLFAHAFADNHPDLKSLLRPVLFIAPSMRLLDLLQEMRIKRQHMALVVDEFGGIDGLITIEDLVEEIVGEIEDEHDESETPQVYFDKQGAALIDARFEIEELETLMGRSLRDSDLDEIDTVGGLVFALAGRVPVRGEVIRHPDGFEFEIQETDLRRVKRVKMTGYDFSTTTINDLNNSA